MRILSLFFVATFVIGFGAGCSSTSGASDGGATGGNGSGGNAGASGGAVGTGGTAAGTGGAAGGSGGKGGGGAAGAGGAAGGSAGKGGGVGAAGAGGASGGGGKGGGGVAGAGGAAGAGGDMTCSPACGNGSICVAIGTEGGALIMPNDAGVCPIGRHLSGQTCVSDLSYACMTIPAGCAGTVTCACASSLCPTLHICQEPSGGILSCIEEVP